MQAGNRGTIRAAGVMCACAAAVALGVPGSASAAMESKELRSGVCKTVGGGKFVRIPGSGGKKIDRRLLRDVRWMKRRYNIGIGDGYALTGHNPNGEHPIGLALDIFSGGGANGWNKIDKLAKLAEPRQNQPVLPWRWVGYDGDAGHGRGHHLHLSWAHSSKITKRGTARWVLTRRCPKGASTGSSSSDDGGGVSASRQASRDGLAGLAPVVPELE